jgi:hypothetical protein
MKKGNGLIESIDVVVRPPKGTGRGYKKIREGEESFRSLACCIS